MIRSCLTRLPRPLHLHHARIRPATTLAAVVETWTTQFAAAGVSEPAVSAELIAAHCVGKKTLAGVDRASRLPPATTAKMTTLAMQRMDGVPVQYIIGEWDFRHLTLEMRPPVLIPRPETEQLVELVVEDLRSRLASRSPSETPLRVLEIGCGSGAICLSLLHEVPYSEDAPWSMSAIDISGEAVELTSRNAASLKLEDRLELRHASVQDLEKAPFAGPFSLIVSNPPYLSPSFLSSLPLEVSRHEDPVALFGGGVDGCEVISAILRFAAGGGVTAGAGLWIEIEPSQKATLKKLIDTPDCRVLDLKLKGFFEDHRNCIRFANITSK